MMRRGHPFDGDRRQAEEVRSLSMLVDADQLPGPGWRVTRDRTWVTGELDPESDKSRRAMEAGLVTAWRSFEQDVTGRAAWVEVVPYATVDDAALSRRQSPRYFVGADGPDQEVVSGGEVTGSEITGVAGLWLYEKTVSGPGGLRVSRYAAGTVGRILCIASCSGGDGAWRLDDLLALAALLAARVGDVEGDGRD